MKSHRIVPGLAAAALLTLGLTYSDVAGARFGTGAGEAAKGAKPSGWEFHRSVDEATLHLRVRLALLEHLKTAAMPIEVDVHTRDVILRGTVKERATIDTAVDVAERVEGVGKVVNRLELASPPEPVAPPVARNVEKVERLLADQILEGRVKTHLLEAVGSSAFDIEVESTDGVVRLIGKVAERRQADLAVEAAWKADGVREVHDLISVSSK